MFIINGGSRKNPGANFVATEPSYSTQQHYTLPTHQFTEHGVSMNSCDFNGLTTKECKATVTNKLKEMDKGGPKTTYKLRDWVFSRQR
jgi:leucyl-tRNA synthetase